MIIKAIKIEPEIAIKIFEKHNILQEEIYDVFANNPKFKRVGGNQYVAIGLSRNRHVTIFFTYDEKKKKEAEITTAYSSSKSQIKSYKRMR